jgi:hypothetical protein
MTSNEILRGHTFFDPSSLSLYSLESKKTHWGNRPEVDHPGQSSSQINGNFLIFILFQ